LPTPPRPSQPAETGAKETIIHHVYAEPVIEKGPPQPVDFVSEDDVRRAVDRGEKIYINKKTILTPSARDLGEEKEVFARV